MHTSSFLLSSIYLYSLLSRTDSFTVLRTVPQSSRLLSTTAIAQGTESNQGGEQQINGEPETSTEATAPDAPGDKRIRSTNVRPRQPTTRINNQDKYGTSLELPKSFIKCGRCSTCFAIQAEDLGNGKGCRVECSVCSHSWFQSRDRLMNLDESQELVSLPPHSTSRIAANIKAGREPGYLGAIKFYVGNLSFDVTESDLKSVFEVVGEVGDVSIATSPEGRSRGFAFVTMMNEEDGEGCLKLDGYELKGRNMNVKKPNN